ncbi:MAG: GGDEF domain-containing protein [Pseudomonadota bacterium]
MVKQSHLIIALSLMIFEINLHAIFATQILGVAAGFQFYILSGLGIVIVSPTRRNLIKIILSVSMIGILIFLFCAMDHQGALAGYPVFEKVLLAVNLFFSTFIFILATVYSNKSYQLLSKQLFQSVYTDDFTQVFNRNFINKFMRQSKAELLRHGISEYAILLVDIDNLMSINQRYQHTTGDQVIIALTDAVKRNTKDKDVIARWDGGQLMICLMSANKDSANNFAEAIKFELYNECKRFGINEHITLSIGMGFSDAYHSFTEVLNTADLNLFRAKRTGTNCIVMD